MSTTIEEGLFEGQPAFVLESAQARVIVLPRIGGKVAALIDKTMGQDLLWHTPGRRYQEPLYGSAWATSDMGGWEDCLPTIGAGSYPEWPWRDSALPENGEVWALPWKAQALGDAVALTVHGVRLPYHFEKRVSLERNRVHVHYRISNPSAFPLRYIWAAHPLFRVRPGMRIVLPPDVRVRVTWSRDERLPISLDDVSWPVGRDARGQIVQLDQIGEPASRGADKLYTTALREGWCGLHDPETGQAVVFSFDPCRLPYAGIWINQGGWPEDGPTCYNVGLEPTNGYPDPLAMACAQGVAATLKPGQEQEWELDLRVGQADSVQALLGT